MRTGFDPGAYGEKPEIPVQFRARQAGDGAELVQVRHAMRRRRLALYPK